jgi:hypothetical protein
LAGLGQHIRHLALGTSIVAITALGSVPASAATPAPAWQLSVSSQPTNFAPGASAGAGAAQYLLVATNVGGAATSGPIVLSDAVPAGLTPVSAGGSDLDGHSVSCSVDGQLVTCTALGSVPAGGFIGVVIDVDVDSMPGGSTVTNRAVVTGGGAAAGAEAGAVTTISSTDSIFGFLPGANGLEAALTEADGSTAVQAGSHPYQLTVDLGFPSRPGGGADALAAVGGGLRDLVANLPRGLVVDPGATPVRCVEAQLEGDGCPDASAIGIVSLGSAALFGPSWESMPLYNMVPPPGAATSFGFNGAGIGIYIHLLGGVRSGDFALSARAADLLSRPANPLLGVQVQLWGDPSSPSHDRVRGHCLLNGGSCLVPPQAAAFLTSPGECSSRPLVTSAAAASWHAPGAFHEASYEHVDPDGTPVTMVGCAQLEFEPTVELLRPTTPHADAPSGLEFALRQTPRLQLGTRAPANLREATVTLPAGLALNPAAADGLAACGDGPPANGCPDAAKIGTIEVETPLLEDTLAGAVYLAQPYDNPFGSLLVVYLLVDDPATGVVAKLPGEVEADPRTGRLTARFRESPALPLESVRFSLFGGPRGLLVTPPTCGLYSAVADLTPWSSPEGLSVSRIKSFEISAAVGGACPRSAAAAPYDPDFEAGVTSVLAGSYVPFFFRLSRANGSQRLSTVDATLPPGLAGGLAGIPSCSDSQLAAAACPESTAVGSVEIAAGAGIAPLRIGGRAHLAGPYRGAPLSLALVVPAVVGPFDLGSVVVRVALHVDPRSAQVRAVSDPLPAILQGIPLNIRSVAVELDRRDFTLNPTSCAPRSIDATATSQTGRAAPLADRFQVGGCTRLGFAPRASVRLVGPTRRGAHPQIRTVLAARPSDANIRRVAVTLPSTELLDTRRIGSVCSREEFAAERCPAASAQGYARAWSPLLGQPLEGRVYLRESDARLPELGISLRGQVDLELVGRLDSVRGRLRSTFQALPDVPLTKVVITLRGRAGGLLVNTGGICAGEHRARAGFAAHNGKVHDVSPLLRTDCGKAGRKRPSSEGGTPG